MEVLRDYSSMERSLNNSSVSSLREEDTAVGVDLYSLQDLERILLLGSTTLEAERLRCSEQDEECWDDAPGEGRSGETPAAVAPATPTAGAASSNVSPTSTVDINQEVEKVARMWWFTMARVEGTNFRRRLSTWCGEGGGAAWWQNHLNMRIREGRNKGEVMVLGKLSSSTAADMEARWPLSSSTSPPPLTPGTSSSSTRSSLNDGEDFLWRQVLDPTSPHTDESMAKVDMMWKAYRDQAAAAKKLEQTSVEGAEEEVVPDAAAA